MEWWYFVIAFESAAITAVICLFLVFKGKKLPPASASYKTMIVLGSGGHTAEMFKFLATLPPNGRYYPRTYVIANSDSGSQHTLEEFENSSSKKAQNYEICFIPRSRVVGQSYFTSIFTTLHSFIHCVIVVWKQKPDLVLANGPGTCLPILFSAWIYRTIGLKPCALVLMESYACVEHPSLTAKLMKPFVDKYCVQWPSLLDKKMSSIVYTGRVPLSNFESPPIATSSIGKPNLSYVLVTVGSTLFEALIEAIDTQKFINILKEFGFKGIHVQYGKGKPPSNISSVPGFEVVCYDHLKKGWKDEVANSGLVIGHAGAGTILDSLESEKPIIVIANDKLMSQHQTEIAKVMAELEHVLTSTPGKIVSELPSFLKKVSNLRVFPKREANTFADELNKLLPSSRSPASSRPFSERRDKKQK